MQLKSSSQFNGTREIREKKYRENLLYIDEQFEAIKLKIKAF
jgi:hypothetical protein